MSGTSNSKKPKRARKQRRLSNREAILSLPVFFVISFVVRIGLDWIFGGEIELREQLMFSIIFSLMLVSVFRIFPLYSEYID